MSRHADVLRRFLPIIEKYLDENDDPSVPVVRYLEPESLRRRIDLSLTDRGASLDEMLPLVEDYLAYGVRTGHKSFGNQLYSGFNKIGFIGDVLTSLTNTSMYTYEVAPVATLMELELVRKMLDLVGFSSGEGIFCTGGSNANLIGVLCGRDHAFPEVKFRGFAGTESPELFVSDQAHYSFLKAANQLGMGTHSVVTVATDRDGRMIPEQLDAALRESKRRGATPFFVGATAGTTVLGSFDPLDAIARVCRNHDVWMHVDGSWGAPIALSSKHRHLLGGCDAADSVTWDAHKLMGATLMCAAFLTRHPGTLERACSIRDDDADYLFHEAGESAFDLGRTSLQCGRRVDALKLWLIWKHFGDEGFAARIDRLFDLARFASERIDQDVRLEQMAPLQSLNVCFRYTHDGERDLNALNLAIREQLRKSGRTFVNYSHLGQDLVLRLVLAHPDLREEDMEAFLDLVGETGDRLVQDLEPVQVPDRARSPR